jgi:hypothetical protein
VGYKYSSSSPGKDPIIWEEKPGIINKNKK